MRHKKHVFLTAISAILLLSLVGCSRTLTDIEKWKARGNIEKLVKALEDPKSEIRKGAAEALGELKAGVAADPLAAIFNDSDNEVGLAAVTALVAIGSDPAIGHLISALKLENSDARIIAAAGLGTLNATKANEALIAALDDDDENVTCVAATSLGQIGDEKASAPLAAKLKSPSATLRLACAAALAHTGGTAAVKGLVRALADENADVRSAVIGSLVAIGKPGTPSVLEALKDTHAAVRSGAISVLKKTDSVPTSGSDIIWYKLAVVSVDGKDDLNMEVVNALARMGDDTVEILLEAAAHNVADFREHAFHALESIGKSCTETATKTAADFAGDDGLTWFNGRTAWSGSPSWRIDLWAAIASLNPNFDLNNAAAANMQSQGRNAFRVITSPDFAPTREYIPLLIRLLGDTTIPPPTQPDVDEFGMPVVKKAVDRFRGEANQQMAKEKLMAAGNLGVYPLIAAITDQDDRVAGHAAEILGELGESCALEPLMSVVEQKIAAGELLTTSPFYNALQKMDDPSAEPVLLKIRPNTDRAIRIFERQYTGVRAMSAESNDATSHPSQPIAFRIGFIEAEKMGELHVTFSKGSNGDWVPYPALPSDLPQ